MLYSTREVQLPVKSRRASLPERNRPFFARHFRCSSGEQQTILKHRTSLCSWSFHKSWRTSDRWWQETDTRGHRISFRRSLGTKRAKKKDRRRCSYVTSRRGKRDPGRKLRKLATTGARDYANSLTNVSCNQTAIYQSINSTNRTIYGLLRAPSLSFFLVSRLVFVSFAFLRFFHSLFVSFRPALG